MEKGLHQKKEPSTDAFSTAPLGRRVQGKAFLGPAPCLHTRALQGSVTVGKDRMHRKRLIKGKTLKRPLTRGYSLPLK